MTYPHELVAKLIHPRLELQRAVLLADEANDVNQMLPSVHVNSLPVWGKEMMLSMHGRDSHNVVFANIRFILGQCLGLTIFQIAILC